MKRTVKIIALCLVIVTLSVCFGACDAIEEAKNKQAFYLNSSETKISFRGNTYKILSGSDKVFNPYAYNEGIYITNQDVPVLLSEFEGDYAYYIKESDIIIDDTATSDSFNQFVYCNEEVYDEYEEAIEKVKYDRITFSYYKEEKTEEQPLMAQILGDEFANFETKYYIETRNEEDSKKFLDLLEDIKNEKLQPIDDSIFYGYDWYDYYFIEIYVTDKNAFVYDGNSYTLYLTKDGKIQLSTPDGVYELPSSFSELIDRKYYEQQIIDKKKYQQYTDEVVVGILG